MADRVPFVGPSYHLKRKKADVQRAINLMPTRIESGSGKSGSYLQSIPGLHSFSAAPPIPPTPRPCDLYLPFDGDLLDHSGKNHPVAVTNVTVASSPVNLGTGSGNFTTGGKLFSTIFSIPNDFTLEYRVYPTSAANGQDLFVFDTVTAPFFYGSMAGNGTGVSFGWNILSQVYNESPAFTHSLNQWYALAVSRSGSTTYFFVNGVLLSQIVVTAPLNMVNKGLQIGGAYAGIGNAFTGYLDEIILTIGVGLYTGNYVVPGLRGT